MFDFLNMMGNYEARKVDLYEDGDLRISTAAVSDGSHPFETAVAYPAYNSGNWVIVESYDTKDEAQDGHNEWIKKMTEDPLPNKLVDCANSEISQICGETGGRMQYQNEDERC